MTNKTLIIAKLLPGHCVRIYLQVNFYWIAILRDYRICIPNKDISKKFEKVVYDIFKQQHNLLVENKSLESLKQFLLPLLMNGQVIVTKNWQ